ncbi:UNVERIFIED_CONTAM: HAD family hydrolase, partial [Salmonella enterica subsp. enterica serovar Weltevreden]
VPFRPGALELLEELREAGIPCVMVTMSYRSLAEAVIAACPPGSFAGLVAGDDVAAGKPDPEPYLAGAALLGGDPSECVALADSRPGLASAVAAGTVAVCG